ncbi:hypothetical protein CRYUN_Cryun01aG0253000 [Craigia yunnanensis]
MVGTSFKGWCRYFQYNEGNKEEDKEKNRADARNALLVVATLIAAVTFQAGASPPGSGKDSAVSVSESSAYYVFLTSNTLAFSAAVLVIMSLTHKFPFMFEVRVAAVSMIITYGSAVFFITVDGKGDFRLVLITAAAPLVMRFLIQLFVKLRNREPEPPCLIQAFTKPRNKTTEPLKDEIMHVKT